MDTTVDSAFIRRAVEQADLNAVRVTLYQHTGDPEIAALPTAINLDDAGQKVVFYTAAPGSHTAAVLCALRQRVAV